MTTLSPLSGSPVTGIQDVAIPAPSQAEVSASMPTATSTGPTKPTAKKPRKRVNTAEKRHQHNAIERQRRETLNGKFIVLARLLPSLANHRRPSKSAIVNGSISHLTYQRDQRLLAAKLLRQMAAEQDSLLREVNEWRKTAGFTPKDAISNWAAGIEEVCNVEKEVFGTFNNVDGEDGDDDDQDDMPQVPVVPSTNASMFAQTNGLLTPRPSTDVASAQALLNSMLAQESRVPIASPTVGLDWSSDFAWSVNNAQRPQQTPSVHSHANVFAFPSFVNESNDSPTSGSPANSQQGPVLTPPTFTEMLSNHTPSPRSSNGLSHVSEETNKAGSVQSGPAGWHPAEMLFAHQQIQLQRQQQQSQQGSNFPAFLNPNAVQPMQSPTDSDMFTQHLMASMFPPQQTISALQLQAQLEQWRKSTMAPPRRPTMPSQPSVQDLREAVRLGMGLQWQQQANQNQTVEGF